MRDPMQATRFRLSREVAGRLLGDAEGLRALLSYVEARQQAAGIDIATRIHLDIAEAIVDAHIEELSEPGLPPAAVAALRNDSRRRRIVAAVHYVATRDLRVAGADVDEPDDLEILRWATDFARGACPVG